MQEAIITYKKDTLNICVGQKYNRLKIDDLFLYRSKLYAKCVCDCGTIVNKVYVRSLLSGNTKSCGCLNRELTI